VGERKVLRPRGGGSLLLLLHDVNLPRPDKYGTVQVTSFLQQCIAHGGFYDDTLEFIHLADIQIVASINPGSTLGRQALSTRFTGASWTGCWASSLLHARCRPARAHARTRLACASRGGSSGRRVQA